MGKFHCRSQNQLGILWNHSANTSWSCVNRTSKSESIYPLPKAHIQCVHDITMNCIKENALCSVSKILISYSVRVDDRKVKRTARIYVYFSQSWNVLKFGSILQWHWWQRGRAIFYLHTHIYPAEKWYGFHADLCLYVNIAVFIQAKIKWYMHK